tara:strand:- start:10625 stop:12187 length:1563 start_codon:yes stop_codon:yes gene_type:complete
MNKGEIRTRILEQVDWSPDQSTTFKDKVDRLINRAYQVMSLEAPFTFFDDEARIITEADVTSVAGTAEDALRVIPTDTNVLERRYLASTSPVPQSWADGHAGSSVGTGRWDGRTIEITDGTITYRRKIREVWLDSSSELGALTVHDRISLDVPWINTTSEGMSYRIYTPEYGIPADVIEMRSARVYGDTHYPLSIQNQYYMERHEYTDYQGDQTGRPETVFRGKHFQLDAPTQAPRIIPYSATKGLGVIGWTGPEPIGSWDFCYTWCWGYLDEDMRTPKDHLEPRWESAPSPISEIVTHDGNAAIRYDISVPNIDHMTDYWTQVQEDGTITQPASSGRSGLYARVYVRRHTTANMMQHHGITEENIEQSPKIFFLLNVAHLDNTTQKIVAVHRGERPDYYTRLKESHGYQTLRFWPMPDARYEIDLRVLRRPQPLVHDHDAPRIHEEAIDALIERVLVLFYEVQGMTQNAELSNVRYQNLLQTITKRYGNISGMRIRKKSARVGKQARETRVVPFGIVDP